MIVIIFLVPSICVYCSMIFLGSDSDFNDKYNTILLPNTKSTVLIIFTFDRSYDHLGFFHDISSGFCNPDGNCFQSSRRIF
jgi:hypothetical protein